jgi:nucleoside-triphosphatase THEP1
MLFLLTGAIQIGKTRWLKCLVDDLEAWGVVCLGVLSPGIWREGRDGEGGVAYEKLGIETVFLPGRERAVFARRRDLAEQEGALDARWQSSQAALGWVIPDEALKAVNRHFDALGEAVAPSPSAQDARAVPPGILIVDELGRLELEADGGFTSAVRLLQAGPTAGYGHALIVVRDSLVEKASVRFASVWSDVRIISPHEEGRQAVLNAAANATTNAALSATTNATTNAMPSKP